MVGVDPQHKMGGNKMEIQTDLSNYGIGFLKVADVSDKDQLVITSSCKEEINQWGKKRMTCTCMHNGIAKKMSMAAPQVQQLVGILGSNPLGWIGKSVNVRKKAIKLKDGTTMTALDFFGLSQGV